MIQLKYEQNEKQVWNSEKEIIGSFYFWMQNNAFIYERKYKKIQNIIADLGGIIHGIHMIGYFLNWIIYKFTLLKDINHLLCYFTDLKNKKKIRNNINFIVNSSSILNINSNINNSNIKQITINQHNDDQCCIFKNITPIKNRNIYELKDIRIYSFSNLTFYSFFKWIIYCYPLKVTNPNKVSYIYNIYKQFINEKSIFFLILKLKEFLKMYDIKEYNYCKKPLFFNSKSFQINKN